MSTSTETGSHLIEEYEFEDVPTGYPMDQWIMGRLASAGMPTSGYTFLMLKEGYEYMADRLIERCAVRYSWRPLANQASSGG